MIITIQQLEERGACRPAIVAFWNAVGEKTADFEWNPPAQGWLLAAPRWRQWLGWAYEAGIIPLWTMSKADLSFADLSFADLRFADLSEANLRGANLHKANLHKADLSFADLHKANLSEANLRFADLSFADLHKANLYGADSNKHTRWPYDYNPHRGERIGL